MSHDLPNNAVINIDFCGACHGTCSGCLLTAEERQSDEAFLTGESLVNAVKPVLAPGLNDLYLGVGRGNVLTLPEKDIQSIVALRDYVEASGKVNLCHMEISTSVVGRIEDQIKRGIEIIDRLDSDITNARFNIVANAAINSNNYWLNINRFIRELAAHRTARGDRERIATDVFSINVSASALPSLDKLAVLFSVPEEADATYIKPPVNIVWSAINDQGQAVMHNLELMEQWVADVYAAAKQQKWNLKFIKPIRNAYTYGQQDIDSTIDAMIHHAKHSTWFVDKNGTLSAGVYSVFGDIDQFRATRKEQVIRFDRQHNAAQMLDVINQDLLAWRKKMVGIKACRACDMAGPCFASGSWRVAQINHTFNQEQVSASTLCPSAVREVFRMIASE